jgi:hypothetical protein
MLRHQAARARVAEERGDTRELLRARVRHAIARADIAFLTNGDVTTAEQELRSARHALRRYCLENE